MTTSQAAAEEILWRLGTAAGLSEEKTNLCTKQTQSVMLISVSGQVLYMELFYEVLHGTSIFCD